MRWSLLIVCLGLLPGAAGQTVSWDEWLLPNFSGRLTAQVSNPASSRVKGLAAVPVVAARTLAPDFPGTLAIAMMNGNPVPSQIVDLDGDGFPDEVLVQVELAAGETRPVDVYYSTTLHDTIAYPKKVQAKHNYGYNFQTGALESEVIGFRTYGAFFLDVQARREGHPGLNNDLLGYLAIRMDFHAGRDIFHAGDTLGLGGIFLRRAGQVYRPPFNVPDYAHKPSPEMVPHYRVIASGPLRAIVEARLDRWTVGEDLVSLTARYSIDADEGFARCRVEAVPIRIQPGHVYEFGAGVRDLPNGTNRLEEGSLVVTGNQDRRIGPVALSLYYDPSGFQSHTSLRLKESGHQVTIVRNRLSAGQAVTAEYAVAGAWGGSGIPDPGEYLARLAGAVKFRLKTGELSYHATPRPERLNGEAQ